MCDVSSTEKLTAQQISKAIEPDTFFERIVARKQVGLSNGKDFLSIKG